MLAFRDTVREDAGHIHLNDGFIVLGSKSALEGPWL